jgi:hypothetical protein
MSWMSIFIRRVHGEARVAGGGADADVDEPPHRPSRRTCGPKNFGPRRSIRSGKSNASGAPSPERLGSSGVVVLLQAVEHAGDRLLDHDARADLGLVRARHRASSP